MINLRKMYRIKNFKLKAEGLEAFNGGILRTDATTRRMPQQGDATILLCQTRTSATERLNPRMGYDNMLKVQILSKDWVQFRGEVKLEQVI